MNESKSDLVKQKKDILIEMTDGFADRHLDEEYKMLCRKLINKMSRKRQVPFLSGRLDIWAASVVYALGQINFLFNFINLFLFKSIPILIIQANILNTKYAGHHIYRRRQPPEP
jgi:hypothetical protein